ncbi:hypothetical protein L917_15032 [Phytophthora nicotianae]|uniref:Uncharacterized protein n=1 Tax=Phytophthora nicotianae TaxID=4792 RepID=W2KM41_PHYNI|nr:hypothetical protein L917_15032 [Phytophthora nicotianae]
MKRPRSLLDTTTTQYSTSTKKYKMSPRDVCVVDELSETELVSATAKLRVFPTRKDSAWMQSGAEDAKELKRGDTTAFIETLAHDDNELYGEDPLDEFLAKFDAPTLKQIHVLVLVPQDDDEQGRARKEARVIQLPTRIAKEDVKLIADLLDIDK